MSHAPHPMTEAQAAASNPLISAFVSASAGTGKTHVLTARVLRALLMGVRPEEILCLTFTKAAAAEMTERLFDVLAEWLTLDDATLRIHLRNRCGVDADAAMLTRARTLFARVVDLPDGIAIQTFHSFCQSLLGRFPLEAGMAPGFRAVDEKEAKSVMSAARSLTLAGTHSAASLPDTAFEKALALVAVRVSEGTFDDLISKLEFHQEALEHALRTHGGTHGVQAAIERYLDLPEGLSAQAMLGDYLTDMYEERGDALRATISPLASSKAAGDQKRSLLLASTLGQPLSALLDDPTASFTAWRSVFLTQKGERQKGRGAAPFFATKAIYEAHGPTLDILGDEQDHVVALNDLLARRDMADMTAALVTLGARQLSSYAALKAHEGLVDFADMVDRTVAMFQEPGTADWVLYKLDNKITHILVDEAQDTNRAQWHIVEALAAEFFAGLGTRDDADQVPRSVFAVGDDKQSIFSFQKADPKQFDQAQERLTNLAHGAGMDAKRVDMNTSFRSSPVILGLVDHVFRDEASARVGLTANPGSIQHGFSRKDAGGKIELWPLEVPHPAPEAAPWQPPTSAERQEDAEIRAARKMAARIDKMVNGGEVLPSRGTPIRAGDILVLLKRRKGVFIDTLTASLKRFGVAVAGRDRMALTENLAARDLIALGRAAVQPEDDLTLATVLKGPLVNLSEDDLFTLAYKRGGQSLFARLMAYPDATAPQSTSGASAISDAAKTFLGLIADADVKTPYEFYADILGPKGGRRTLVARLGGDTDDTLDTFLEAAHSFQIRQPASLIRFLDQLERSEDVIKRDAEAAGDQVRIMTTHGAKGLEAPIVFLTDVAQVPDTSQDFRVISPRGLGDTRADSDILLWTSGHTDLSDIASLKEALKANQLAEYRRLLYVALTRARDQLYVIGWRGTREIKPECWYEAIREGLEAMDGVETLDDGTIRLEILPTSPPQPPEDFRGSEPDSTEAETVPLPDWLFTAPKPEPKGGLPISPSKLDDAIAADDVPALSPIAETFLKPAALGTHLHHLIQWVGTLPHDAAMARAQAYLAEPARGLTDAEQASALARLDGLLRNAKKAGLFNPGSKPEVAVAGRLGSLVISGRIDRLLISNSEIVFADFKSGERIPNQASAIPQAHIRQMALYKALLAQTYPAHQIKAVLVYAENGALFELDAAALDRALASIDGIFEGKA